MPVDLTDDEKAALIELLRGTIDRDRFPLSPPDQAAAEHPRKARDPLGPGNAEPDAEAKITARRAAREEPAAMSSSGAVTLGEIAGRWLTNLRYSTICSGSAFASSSSGG